MTRNGVVVVIGLMALAAPLQAAPSALREVQALTQSDDLPVAPPVATALEGKPCEWPAYQGTCFYDEENTLVYWILRRRGPDGPEGEELVGYPSVLEKQNEYNSWMENTVRAHPENYPPGKDLASEQPVAMFGWGGLAIFIPKHLEPTGEFNRWTLAIPFYMSIGRLATLEKRFLEDCPNIPGLSSYPESAELCKYGLQGSNPTEWPEDNAAQIQMRVFLGWISVAERNISGFYFGAWSYEVPQDLRRPEQVKPAVLARMSKLEADLNGALDKAEAAQNDYRELVKK